MLKETWKTTARPLIVTIIFIAGSYSGAAHPAPIESQNCETYADKINRLQELNARGGTARQQAQRRNKINDYEIAFHKCRNTKKIDIVSGETKKLPTHHRKLHLDNRQNPQLQQLIKTCNYWVEQTNSNPSWHNSNYRDTACRAASESQNAIYNSRAKSSPNIRKLSDCIKPNNVIDDDVNQCIKGNKAARWKNP